MGRCTTWYQGGTAQNVVAATRVTASRARGTTAAARSAKIASRPRILVIPTHISCVRTSMYSAHFCTGGPNDHPRRRAFLYCKANFHPHPWVHTQQSPSTKAQYRRARELPVGDPCALVGTLETSGVFRHDEPVLSGCFSFVCTSTLPRYHTTQTPITHQTRGVVERDSTVPIAMGP